MQRTRGAPWINGPAALLIIANKGMRCRHYVHAMSPGQVLALKNFSDRVKILKSYQIT
ncbi:MAG: hypothetical protein ACREXO_18310 [Advenella sp.]